MEHIWPITITLRGLASVQTLANIYRLMFQQCAQSKRQSPFQSRLHVKAFHPAGTSYLIALTNILTRQSSGSLVHTVENLYRHIICRTCRTAAQVIRNPIQNWSPSWPPWMGTKCGTPLCQTPKRRNIYYLMWQQTCFHRLASTRMGMCFKLYLGRIAWTMTSVPYCTIALVINGAYFGTCHIRWTLKGYTML